MRGLFITFEGPDGAGKTTQLNRLAERLTGDGLDVVVTREPGGTAIGDQLRAVLLDPENRRMTVRTEVLLYAASRAQHVEEKIIPALQRGAVVLCDRFVDASIAYQAYGHKLDPSFVKMVNRFAADGLEPDRTYMFDLPIERGRQRLLERLRQTASAAMDRIEQRDDEYHRRVREGFLAVAAEQPDRVVVLNADRPEDEIAADIYADFKYLLKTATPNIRYNEEG